MFTFSLLSYKFLIVKKKKRRTTNNRLVTLVNTLDLVPFFVLFLSYKNCSHTNFYELDTFELFVFNKNLELKQKKQIL